MEKLKKNQLNLLLIYISFIFLLILGLLFDKEISIFITGNRINYLNDLMIWLSYFGTALFVLVFMTSLFMWQERKRNWILPLWASLAISMAIIFLLKTIIIRPRPFEVIEAIKALQNANLSSFPSGHTTAVFSTLAILDKEFPKFKWFWLLFSCLVAFSRIYLGLHYLTDVVTAALIGFTISLIITKNHKFFIFWKKEKRKK